MVFIKIVQSKINMLQIFCTTIHSILLITELFAYYYAYLH